LSDNIYNAPKSKLDGKVDDDSLRKIYSPAHHLQWHI